MVVRDDDDDDKIDIRPGGPMKIEAAGGSVLRPCYYSIYACIRTRDYFALEVC